MSEGFNPLSDDGARMITPQPVGYAIYSVDGSVDPKAESRTFVQRGLVTDWEQAQQWLQDGEVRGQRVTIAVEPVKVKSGKA
jgi:hypothetical protein